MKEDTKPTLREQSAIEHAKKDQRRFEHSARHLREIIARIFDVQGAQKIEHWNAETAVWTSPDGIKFRPCGSSWLIMECPDGSWETVLELSDIHKNLIAHPAKTLDKLPQNLNKWADDLIGWVNKTFGSK